MAVWWSLAPAGQPVVGQSAQQVHLWAIVARRQTAKCCGSACAASAAAGCSGGACEASRVVRPAGRTGTPVNSPTVPGSGRSLAPAAGLQPASGAAAGSRRPIASSVVLAATCGTTAKCCGNLVLPVQRLAVCTGARLQEGAGVSQFLPGPGVPLHRPAGVLGGLLLVGSLPHPLKPGIRAATGSPAVARCSLRGMAGAAPLCRQRNASAAASRAEAGLPA